MKYFLFMVLFWTVPCLAGTCQSEVLPKRTDLIFSKHDGQNTGYILGRLLKHLKVYRIGPVDEENDNLFHELIKVEEKFRPLFRRQIEKLGWIYSEKESMGLHHFVIPREEIIGTYPILAELMPPNATYSFAPSYQIPWRADAVYSSQDTGIMLPLTLLLKEPDIMTAQSIVHEAVHHFLELIRRQSGIPSFAFTVVPGPEAYERLSARIHPYHAAQFSPEEIFAYLVNALNSYELECAGILLKPKSNFQAFLNASYPAFIAYFGTMLPEILDNQTDGYFVEEKAGLLFVNGKETYKVMLQSPAKDWPNKSSEEIRREMNKAFLREAEILVELREVYATFIRETRARVDRNNCEATKPVWEFLESIGLPRSQFKILRR